MQVQAKTRTVAMPAWLMSTGMRQLCAMQITVVHHLGLEG